MDKKKAKNGFTLIETIVVVAMMGLMMAVGSVYFSTNSDQRAVDETANKLISQIEIARNNAKVRNSPTGGTESNFRYVELEVRDGVAIITNSRGYIYSETPILSTGADIDDITGCGLCFAAGDGKLVDSSGESIEENVELEIIGSSSSKKIIIDTTGLVQKEVVGGVIIPAIQTSTPKIYPTFAVTPILGTPGPTRTPTPVPTASNTPVPTAIPTATRTPTPTQIVVVPTNTLAPTRTPMPTVNLTLPPAATCASLGGTCIDFGHYCIGRTQGAPDCDYRCCLPEGETM